ncbi:FtsW/RodA/SpoVE family cell cycle protein [Synechococcus sp. M16CYN]|uniref:FtsW/RodA/SpoVE family cell cycle protein n=1 Tax=Synechococcus sp. M16CYN TaxID=3103139 RepID=UPI003256469A
MPLSWQLWPAEARLLVGLAAFWSVAGLVILASASWWVAQREMGDGAFYIKRQIIWLIAGWSVLGITVRINLRCLLQWSGPGLWVGLILIAATLTMGTTVNGASRWLVVGPLQVQPSELVKPFVVLQAANVFAQWTWMKIDQKLLWLASFCGLLLLTLKQPDLSTAALMGLTLWMMALATGLRWRSLLGIAFAGGSLGTSSILINEYQRLRVLSFLDPWKDPTGDGYQLIQSLLAIGSGGVMGQGYGLSTQKLQYLPIQSTDFIYAVFAEEFGFIGSMMLLVFLMIITWVGLRVALRCRGARAQLVSIGCCAILISQSMLNIAVASGAMPTTGLPLPLISYGGNSLMSSLVILGLLIRCSLESTGLIGGRSISLSKSIRRKS